MLGITASFIIFAIILAIIVISMVIAATNKGRNDNQLTNDEQSKMKLYFGLSIVILIFLFMAMMFTFMSWFLSGSGTPDQIYNTQTTDYGIPQPGTVTTIIQKPQTEVEIKLEEFPTDSPKNILELVKTTAGNSQGNKIIIECLGNDCSLTEKINKNRVMLNQLNASKTIPIMGAGPAGPLGAPAGPAPRALPPGIPIY